MANLIEIIIAITDKAVDQYCFFMLSKSTIMYVIKKKIAKIMSWPISTPRLNANSAENLEEDWLNKDFK